MEMFWPILAAIMGLVVGSFLNVAINRLHWGKSLNGRSACPHCSHPLGVKDLFPVLSFIFLRGKCAYCAKPISWQYPMVELATALSFLLIAMRLPFGPEAVFMAVLTCFFIVIAVYDLKHLLILDKVVYPGAVLALAFALYKDFSDGCQWGMSLDCATISGLLGILAISGFFFFQYAVSKGRWIGFGDVKFGLLLGMAVGFPLAVFLLFVAYMLGAVAGVGLVASGRAQMASKMPFGTFLALSAVITLLYGQGLMDAYLKLIGF